MSPEAAPARERSGVVPLRSARFTFAPASSNALSMPVARAAVAENDGLDQRGPAEVVDVVERRAGRDQLAHDAVVAEMRGRDQRGAVVAAGDELGARAARERGFSARRRRPRRSSPRRSGRARARRIGAGRQQRADRVALAEERRDMQRRASIGIARVDRMAAGRETRNRGDVATHHRRKQAGIACALDGRRRDLRKCGQRATTRSETRTNGMIRTVSPFRAKRRFYRGERSLASMPKPWRGRVPSNMSGRTLE